ncbi:uncharacterized protein UTRI_00880 [Ustilago trichophora]|uniref:RNA methyltransferase n=1 Tax=Ustilago trichophora TaxID=86804 RepID=A0A5C3DSL4_9BASI|nr:uncharacterized protein UTRI_00880 [Ustilago trichophora]
MGFQRGPQATHGSTPQLTFVLEVRSSPSLASNINLRSPLVCLMPHNTAEHKALRRHHVNKASTSIIARPVYGNFQRYYHIRNPASGEQTESDHVAHDDAIHPALALDSRVAAILKYLSAHYDDLDWTDQHSCIEGVAGAGSVVTVLDIGCNSGKLTIQLAQTLPRLLEDINQASQEMQTSSSDGAASMPLRIQITGVDIDPSLIKQAKESAAVARSLYRPHLLSADQVCGTISWAYKGLRTPHLPAEAAFFPSVFPTLFGGSFLGAWHDSDQHRDAKRHKIGGHENGATIPSQDGRSTTRESLDLAPPHLNFLAAEWVNPSSPVQPFHYPPSTLSQVTLLDNRKHNLILALSITKWIHIQQSDSGLILFFARISHTLRPGGLLFLERQEWRSYHSAKNMDGTIKGKIKALRLRPGQDFDYLLESMGLRLVQTVAYGQGYGFVRPLQVFQNVKREDEGGKEGMVEQVLKGAKIAWVARSPESLSG